MKLRTSRLTKSLRPILLAVPLWLACQGVAYAGSWKVNLQDADIRAFINEVANITNKNFVLDPRINGNVTVISNRAMSEEEIFQLFLSVMQVNGVTAIDKEGVIELKPDNLAKQSGLPVDLYGEISGEQMVTRVVYLNNTQATEILSAIRPLMPQSAHAAAVPSVNALVLSDRASSLNELELVVQALDTGAENILSVIPLRHTDPDRMMDMLSELIGKTTQANGANASGQLKIIADSTSDRLLVTGSPEQIAKIQAMVERIDTLPNKQMSGMRVFRLNYSDASHVANIVRAMVTGNSINSAESASTLTKASLANASSSSSSNSTASTSSTSANLTSLNSSSSASTGSGITDRFGHPFSIIADQTKNAIYVNASGQTLSEISNFIDEIDQAEVQVLIQAAIIEVSGDDLQQLGIQWALGSPSTGYSLINFNNGGASAAALATSILSRSPSSISSAASSIAGALLGLGSSRKNSSGETEFYGAILQAIDKTTSANLLSTPSITTLNHKQAHLLVGQNVPFVTGSYTTNSSGNSSPFQTIERQDVGIQLNVIPHVGTDGVVKLEVSQEVSSVVESSTSNISGLTTNKSSIDTTVLARDGETVALGGLMRENNTQSQEKVPGVGDVPLLGRLFRSDNNSSQKSNLIIFLRPTVIRRDSGGVLPSITEREGDKIKTMQLIIDNNGTIKQIPLSGTQGWYGQDVKLNDRNAAQLMSVNPLTSTHNTQLPQGITQVTPNPVVTQQMPVQQPIQKPIIIRPQTQRQTQPAINTSSLPEYANTDPMYYHNNANVSVNQPMPEQSAGQPYMQTQPAYTPPATPVAPINTPPGTVPESIPQSMPATAPAEIKPSQPLPVKDDIQNSIEQIEDSLEQGFSTSPITDADTASSNSNNSSRVQSDSIPSYANTQSVAPSDNPTTTNPTTMSQNSAQTPSNTYSSNNYPNNTYVDNTYDDNNGKQYQQFSGINIRQFNLP